ncbi:MAG: hypothetical protein L3K04_06860, partial [Thermoplasmata archaeon]|nr:hypothetical protein [Thermoplasmata archaeon]
CVGSGTRLLDWVYAPAIPHLEERAIGRGAVYEDGRRLLLYQASEAFRELFGVAPRAEAERLAWEALCVE